jgi:DNA-binding SARP family transcriptional activator
MAQWHCEQPAGRVRFEIGRNAVESRVLGPLEVLADGRSIDLGHHKQRALLALLLINANRVVSTDAIREEIWGKMPMARKTLSGSTSRD